MPWTTVFAQRRYCLASVRCSAKSAAYETHLVRLLSHTRLDRLQWINHDQRVVTLKKLN
jgi:hypothetical protein